MTEEKHELRKLLREKYQQVNDTDYRAIDRQITKRVMEQPSYRESCRIFLYASVGHEVDTYDLLQTAYAQGKIVALPKSCSGGIMNFYEYSGSLSVGRFRIPEPDGERIIYPEPDDLMIVPGMAFTGNGYRLGYGGGYYDRYLAKHPCRTMGLCRDSFLAKELPVSWNDLPVDCVITETTVYQCKNGASCEAPLD